MATPSSSSSRQSSDSPKRTVKVAVVGSGLGGLTAAYLLSTLWTRADIEFKGEEVKFEVHVFEKAATLGMDSHSASFKLPQSSDAEWRVDVPMRSFQGGYYPQLIRLYTHLGVAFRKADFSYSFTAVQTPPEKEQPLDFRPHFLYEGASGRKGLSISSSRRAEIEQRPSLFRRTLGRIRLNVAHALWSLLVLILFLRFTILSAPMFRPKNVREMTWEEWVAQYSPSGRLARWTGFADAWDSFITDVCAPLYSGLCTASHEDVARHPAEEFLDFNWRTLGTHHYLVSNGVREVVAGLTAHLSGKQIHTNAPTTALVPDPDDPGLVSVVCTPPDGEPVIYDGFAHVILATQAKYAALLARDYAAQLSGEPKVYAAELSACLARVAYRESIVVNHTDSRLLPADKRDRRDLNFVSVVEPPNVEYKGMLDPSAVTVPPTYSMTTQVLDRPEHIPPQTGTDNEDDNIYQTTNPFVAPDSSRILSVSHIERALLTMDGKEAARLLYRSDGKAGKLQGAARRAKGPATAGLWIAGAYAYYGIPLLEGCVVSARDVVTGAGGIVACEDGRVQRELW